MLVGDLSGFHPDSVNLFNDQMEIAGECSVEDIEFPEAFVELEPDLLLRPKKRKKHQVRPGFFFFRCLSIFACTFTYSLERYF